MSGISNNKAALAPPRSVFWVALFAAFFVYALTFSRYPGFYESGEYITAVWLRGLPHAPGNPVYVWLGWLISHLLPIGSPVVRATLPSVLFGSLSAGCVALAARSLLATRHDGEQMTRLRALLAPVATGLIYAFSLSQWSAAGAAGPEAFQGLMSALFILALSRMHELGFGREEQPYLPRWEPALAGLALGLALTGHRSALWLIPVLPVFYWLNRERVALPLLNLLKTLGWTLLGWLAWLSVIPLSAGARGINLGYPHEPGRLWEYFGGAGWFQMYLAPAGPSGWAWEAWPEGLLAAALNPALQFTLPLTLALAIGAVLAWRGSRAALALPLSLVAFGGIAVALVADPLAEGALLGLRLLPAFIGMALIIGFAVDALASLAERLLRSSNTRGWESSLLIAAGCLIPVLLVLLPHWSICDRSGDKLAGDYGRNVLNAVPENGILIVSGEQSTASIFTCLQKVEGLRPDVDVIDQRMTWQPWYMSRFNQLHPEVGLSNPRTADADPEGSLIEGRVYHDNPVIDDLLLENLSRVKGEGRPVCFDPWRLDLRADALAHPGLAARVLPAGAQTEGGNLEIMAARFLAGGFAGLDKEPSLKGAPALNIADQYLIACRRIADGFFNAGRAETAIDLVRGAALRFPHAPRMAYARLSLAAYMVSLDMPEEARLELLQGLRETGVDRPLMRGKLLTRLAELMLGANESEEAAKTLDEADSLLEKAESAARDNMRPGEWYDTLEYRIRVLELQAEAGAENASQTERRAARIEAMRKKQEELLSQIRPLHYMPPS